MTEPFLSIVRRLHSVSMFRRWARRIAVGWTVTQRFHGGVIRLDAVEHSWAWTGSRRLENFERDLQDRLDALMRDRDCLVDIGSNIGVMTLSVLLRNPQARAVAIDANLRAIELLSQSLRRNGLAGRAQTFAVAVSSGASELTFEPGGSFTGHVATAGTTVPAVPLPELLRRHASNRAVVKIDIEGYEALLADSFRQLPPAPGSVLAIELHPRGFNGLGDPERVVMALQSRGDLRLQLIGGPDLGSLDPTQFNQLEAQWAP